VVGSSCRSQLIRAVHCLQGGSAHQRFVRRQFVEAAYAKSAGFDAGDWTACLVTGDFAQWVEAKQQIPMIDIELPDHESTPETQTSLLAITKTLGSTQICRGFTLAFSSSPAEVRGHSKWPACVQVGSRRI
jgi:hypothetical protein